MSHHGGEVIDGDLYVAWTAAFSPPTTDGWSALGVAVPGVKPFQLSEPVRLRLTPPAIPVRLHLALIVAERTMARSCLDIAHPPST